WSEAPLSQPKKALEHFKRAMELDPRNAYAIYSGRELLKSQGQYEEAYSLYDAELELETDPSRKVAILYDEAETHRAAGDLQGVTRALERARQIEPQDAELQQKYASSILDRLQAGEEVSKDERASATTLLVNLAEQFDGDHGLAYAGAALDI